MRSTLREPTLALMIFAAMCAVAAADPISYTGSLSTGSGADGALVGANGWDDSSTTLSWTVDNTTTPGKWHYEYTLSVPQGGISHIIIEASDGDPLSPFTSENLFSPEDDPSGWIDDEEIEIQVHTTGSGNPDMPADVYGVKFVAAQGFDEISVTVRFDSDRGPTWGDFYAKDGGGQGTWKTAYNQGFQTADPTVAPASGSEQDHLLVPDTIPEPGVLVLLGLGAWARVQRRRRRPGLRGPGRSGRRRDLN